MFSLECRCSLFYSQLTMLSTSQCLLMRWVGQLSVKDTTGIASMCAVSVDRYRANRSLTVVGTDILSWRAFVKFTAIQNHRKSICMPPTQQVVTSAHSNRSKTASCTLREPA